MKSPGGWTRAPQVAEDIVSIGQLKADPPRRCGRFETGTAPPVVTENGKAAAVMLSPEDFGWLSTQARLVGAVEDGLGGLAFAQTQPRASRLGTSDGDTADETMPSP